MPRLANPEDQGRRRREQNRDNQRRRRRKARQEALALQRGQPEERLNSESVSEEPPKPVQKLARQPKAMLQKSLDAAVDI